MISQLNNDPSLIEALSRLDLETGEIWVDDDQYKVKFSPISGSYMYMVFPPIRYAGTLPKKEINQLYSALYRTSELLSACS